MANKLKSLLIKELSLVDRPANRGANVLLAKRDGGTTMTLNEALIESVSSILEDDGIDAATRNVMLLDTVRQYVQWEGGDGQEPGRGAPKGDSPDAKVAATVKRSTTTNADFLLLAKRAADGEKSDLSSAVWDAVGRMLAKSDQRAGETVEQARARFWTSPNGLIVREASAHAPIAKVDAKAPVVPDRGPALAALYKRATAIGAEQGISVQRAISKIAEARVGPDRELWAAAKVEERARTM